LTVMEIKVLPPRILGMSPVNLALLAPFVLAFLVVIIVSYKVGVGSVQNFLNKDKRQDPVRRELSLRSTLGRGLTLDFTKSWASILTVGTAIVTPITSAQVFSLYRPYFTQQQTTGLALIFGAVLILGPAIYNLVRFQKEATAEPVKFLAGKEPSTRTEPQLQGYVGTFLLASTLTLGAVIGQLIVACILVIQMDDIALSVLGRAVIIGVILFFLVIAIVYIGKMVHTAVAEKGKRREEFKQNARRLRGIYTYEEPLKMP
jgi:Na+-transporting methylmalonyl-CoA/oxaloacetate decarboxylase gamma subunit